ncbi:MAG: 30S ribosomal protein S13 [Methanobacteriota archaeon]|nr:MAG: 30S ribosomal protein S13 [Euryarchaeota archaeon]
MAEKKKDEEFKHLVRIAGRDIRGEKNVVHGIALVKGIGPRTARIVCDMAGVPVTKRIGELTDKNVEDLTAAINGLDGKLPSWLLNRQKDYEAGKDKQTIGADLHIGLREDINRLKKIRSYRGIRHELGLPVRGQRTRSTFRHNATVGVSRKKGAQAQQKK